MDFALNNLQELIRCKTQSSATCMFIQPLYSWQNVTQLIKWSTTCLYLGFLLEWLLCVCGGDINTKWNSNSLVQDLNTG